MSNNQTDPALVVASPTAKDAAEKAADASSKERERHSLTLDQRRELRRWANAQSIRPSHKACIDWFHSQYGQMISQSTVSHSLSPKYSRLDGDNPQLSGSRLRFGNWPDVEKLVLLWYQQMLASGRQPTNDELGEKAKSIFVQLPRYRGESAPEFSPGWIHRFKKRYGLLSRRHRRAGDEALSPAEDVAYLADCVPRVMAVVHDTSPSTIREQVLRVVGVDATLSTCALVRDEILRRLSISHHQASMAQLHLPQPPSSQAQQPHHQQQQQQQQQPEHSQSQDLYADDDPEVVLQNALRQLQQEEEAAEEQAVVAREARERATQRPPYPQAGIMASPGGRAASAARHATPAQDTRHDLTLTPIHSERPASVNDRPIRCPFCVNQRMLRTIKEAVEHMSTHIVV
ncbi:uncharacterized protein CPUR_05123 [Claviceps purpurea 20.1]|uniref:HTH CENPB-type domain-containing protein n=1 Tax=Claviceps purpurea (strain 20.1) TaxID=1111077 RepID=M1VWH3_CLAP2|nr:uncharacterized protein CPUR_05123 [Claviceps purpurea 20.1]